MHTFLTFALLGLGAGATYALVGSGLVLAYRGAGVLNFAQGAFASWAAYTYSGLTTKGTLYIPLAGSVGLGSPMSNVPAIVVAVAVTAVLAALIYLIIIRPLASAPTLVRLVVTLGIAVIFEADTTLRFGTYAQTVPSILPQNPVHIAGISVVSGQLYLAGIAIVVAAILGAVFKYTRFGLATSAANEAPIVAQTMAYSPQTLACVNWTAAAVLAGLAGIFVSPIVGLDPSTQTVLLLSGFVVALAGRLRSFMLVTVAGLVLGIAQSELVPVNTFSWMQGAVQTGDSAVLLFFAIALLLVFRGRAIPGREEINLSRLPVARAQRHPERLVAAILALGTIGIFAFGSDYRLALITSLVVIPIMLSFVVVTGYLGQISLLQIALAGVSGFVLSNLSYQHHIGFPWSALIGIACASIVAVIAGLPALRVRGLQLAIVTLAAGFALESSVFQYNVFDPGGAGAVIASPKLFGMSFGIQSGQYPGRAFGVFVVLVVAACCYAVARLRVSALGRRMLAVRSSERASVASAISVSWVKVQGFALGGILAGIGGVLLSYSLTTVDYTAFTTDVGLGLLVLAYLGGITSVYGAVIAGLLTAAGLFTQVLNSLIPGFNQYAFLIGGVGVILTALANPDGISGAAAKAVERFTRRKAPAPEPAASDGIPAAASDGIQNSTGVGHRRIGDPVLELSALNVRFGSVVANKDVDLTVRRGEIVGLIGPNGAGKTTLIDAVSGHVSATGAISLGGVQFQGMSAARRAEQGLRRSFQSLELFDDLTVVENLKAVGRIAGSDKPQVGNQQSSPEDWLALAGLTRRADDLPDELSYGERRMLGVVRAMVGQPPVVVLDEPGAGLGARERERLRGLIVAAAAADSGVLLVDHDMRLVLTLCDRVVVLVEGRVLVSGAPDEIRADAQVIEAYLGLRRHSDEGTPTVPQQGSAATSDDAVDASTVKGAGE